MTSIFKKGKKQEPENYIPLTGTAIIRKLVESNIKEEVMNNLSRHNLLADSEFGFSSFLQLLTAMEG